MELDELLKSPDALTWAREFMKTVKSRKGEIDTELCLAWFASAMSTAQLRKE